nr:hypothetical protein [Bacilli bacterium]
MRKMLKLLIALVILYFIIQQLFYLFSKGHTVEYIVKSGNTAINVKEILSAKKESTDGYYIELNFDDKVIPFKVYKKYNKRKHMVTDVDLFYGDAYICAKISIKNKTNETDMKCTRNGVVYYYNAIKGYDAKLDGLVSASNYDSTKYVNDEFVSTKDNIEYFPNNYIDNQNIALATYKGTYLFGKNVTGGARYVQLFEKDQYSKTLETLVDNYYVVANYNDVHEFLGFYAINLATGDKREIKGADAISFNSYIQGSVDGKMYLIDIDNKVQYSVEPKRRGIEFVGNTNTGAQIYTKDGWVTKNMNEVVNSRETFSMEEIVPIDVNGYEKAKMVDANLYYLFRKNGSVYNAYIVYAEDNNYTKNYAFTTTDINRINYIGGNVYYIYDDEIRIFTAEGVNKKIVKYNEIKYNTNLNFYAY